MSETIYSKSGYEIKPINKYDIFVDSTMFFIGASNTGKSTVMKYMMKQLRDYIGTVFVISGTEQANGGFSDIVPSPAILYNISESWLETTYKRQEALVQIYNIANDETNIRTVYEKVNTRDSDKKIEKIRKDIKSRIRRSNIDDFTKEKVKKMLKKIVISTMKSHVRKYIDRLSDKKIYSRLSDGEKYVIKYIDLDPKLLIVFDDITVQLKYIKKSDILEKIMQQGRHLQITFMCAMHNYQALPANIRGNAFWVLFTESKDAVAFADNTANGLKDFKRDMISSADQVINKFKPNTGGRACMFYRRNPRELYYIIPSARLNFTFGSEEFIELMNKIEKKKEDNKLDNGNRFTQLMKL